MSFKQYTSTARETSAATHGAASRTSESPARTPRFDGAPPVDRVLTGDCVPIMQSLPGASIDLVVTDPPYLARYRGRDGRIVPGDDRADWVAPAFRQIYRVLKPDSFCVSFYGWPHVETFMRAWKAAGFRPVGHMVWHKEYASRTGFLQARHEQAYLLAKGYPPRPDRPIADVQPWTYSGNRHHPTQKAVAVIEPLIAAFSSPGDLVLDPFLGSGTTALAAQGCGRRYLGIELDDGFTAIAERRLTKQRPE